MIILKYIPIMINSNVKDELIDFGSANSNYRRTFFI